MPAFYVLAAIAIWLGLLSVRGGFRFLNYIKQETARPRVVYQPFVSLIVPFRGIDQGLADNLTALLQQNYPNYEIIFVTDSTVDEGAQIVADVISSRDAEFKVPARVLIAGEATDSGQKVHNLRVAVKEIGSRTEVIVFADSDARPHAEWLTLLVEPLADPNVGASSSYRWFIPVKGGWASHLCGVWNASIASALGANREKNFCWGGATAIRRSTFAELKLGERWRGSVSDDFTLTRVLHEANRPIHFVPECLTASFEDCSFTRLFEFTTRQLRLTRIYAPPLWQAVLVGNSIFVLAFFGGLALLLVRAVLGLPYLTLVVLLAIIFILGVLKALVRLRAVRMALASYGPTLRLPALPQLL